MYALSKYARVFDSRCVAWDKDREFNVMYLQATQNYYNDVLKKRGHVFLRDIYEYLCIPVTSASLRAGWVYDLKNKFADNHIDLGIQSTGRADIQMDFNADGDITGHFKD